MNQRMLGASTAGPSLEQLTVANAMHPGVVTCPLETPLPTVARMMAMYRIHAVIVFNEDSDNGAETELWGVVSDLDLVKAASAGDFANRTAGGTSVTPVVTVERDDPLGPSRPWLNTSAWSSSPASRAAEAASRLSPRPGGSRSSGLPRSPSAPRCPRGRRGAARHSFVRGRFLCGCRAQVGDGGQGHKAQLHRLHR